MAYFNVYGNITVMFSVKAKDKKEAIKRVDDHLWSAQIGIVPDADLHDLKITWSRDKDDMYSDMI